MTQHSPVLLVKDRLCMEVLLWRILCGENHMSFLIFQHQKQSSGGTERQECCLDTYQALMCMTSAACACMLWNYMLPASMIRTKALLQTPICTTLTCSAGRTATSPSHLNVSAACNSIGNKGLSWLLLIQASISRTYLSSYQEETSFLRLAQVATQSLARCTYCRL